MSPRPPPPAPWRSLRGRLLLLALAVEALMLTLLVGNSLRLLMGSMGAQAQAHAAQISPVLSAALVAPLAQRDLATVQAVLEESNSVAGVEYVAVLDTRGRIVAASGWPLDKPLPAADSELRLSLDDAQPRYDVARPIQLAGQTLGTLHFGVNLAHIASARRQLMTQGVAIAIIELVLSAAMLAALGFWITRRLSTLTHASIAVAQGNLAPGQMAEGDDELGRLGAAFNTMSAAVSDRMAQIKAAHDELARVTATVETENARMTALLSAMQIGVLLVDAAGQVVYANPAFIEMWLLHADDAAVGIDALSLMARMREKLADAHQLAPRPTAFDQAGEVELCQGRVLTHTSFPVGNAQGSPLGELFLFTDVSHARRASRQLVEARDTAEAANAAKADFLATMSHEIRTPMNGIIAMSQLALAKRLPDELRGYLDTIRLSADTLLAIVNDILDFSKIDAGHLELERVPFAPARLLAETVELFRHAAAAKQLQLSFAPTDASLLRVVGDPTRLRQIVTNLLANAIKFTAHGSVAVELQTQAVGQHECELCVVVRDTGIGIAPDKLDSVFRAFTQADSSTTRRYGGTGLGLAIVMRLTELMGGQIRVESVPRHGASFVLTLRLPLADDLYASTAPDSALQPLDAPTDARIMVAEDNLVNQLVIESVLRSLGHRCTIARNGIEAVAVWRDDGPFDLVLMDMLMPELDGLGAARCIRATEREQGLPCVPIVALTANATEEDRRACAAAGMDGFIVKPYSVERIEAILRRHLKREVGAARH